MQGETDAERATLIWAGDLVRPAAGRWLPGTDKGVLPADALICYYGPSGHGKSFIALDHAFSVSRHAPVIYIAAEGAGGLWARTQAWHRHYKRPDVGRLWFYRGAVDLMSEQEAFDFAAGVREIGPVLVVVDTLARSMLGGDENSTHDMGLFIAGCDLIRRELGASVLVIHHSRKDGGPERGSAVLRAACDVLVEIVDEDGAIAFRCEKAKDTDPWATRHYRLLTIDLGNDEDGDPITSCVPVAAELRPELQAVGERLSPSQEKVLKALGMKASALIGLKSTDIETITGLTKPTAWRALSALMGSGLVVQSAKGDPWSITDLGNTRLLQLNDNIAQLTDYRAQPERNSTQPAYQNGRSDTPEPPPVSPASAEGKRVGEGIARESDAPDLEPVASQPTSPTPPPLKRGALEAATAPPGRPVVNESLNPRAPARARDVINAPDRARRIDASAAGSPDDAFETRAFEMTTREPPMFRGARSAAMQIADEDRRLRVLAALERAEAILQDATGGTG